VERKLGEKRINNILAVLSKPMKCALDVELISKSPKIGLYKVERPEIEPWDFEQYARMLAAAKVRTGTRPCAWRARRACAAAR
jgi:hypothetical protein